MAGFTYYVPGLSGVRVEELVAGLPDALRAVFREHVPAFRTCSGGPDGGEGQAVKAVEQGNGYFPDAQQWADTGEGYWLGWEKDAKPRPADLERATLITGYNVELGDGNAWQVPSVTFVERKPAFTGGKWQNAVVIPEHQVLIEAADRFLECQTTEERDGKTYFIADAAEMAGLATTALAANYYVGPHEVSALELLSSRNLWGVCQALTDMPAMMKRWKEGQGAADGRAADGQAEGTDG